MKNVKNILCRIGRNFGKLLLCGIFINVLASFFYPGFAEKFPAIYGWFDGWLQLGEFAVKSAFKFVYSLFTGHLPEFWKQNTEAFNLLWQQFVNWLAAL